MEVEVIGGDIESGIRELKKKLKFDNIHAAVAFRLGYIKPSERRVAKQRKALIRKWRTEKRNRMLKERHGNGDTHAGLIHIGLVGKNRDGSRAHVFAKSTFLG